MLNLNCTPKVLCPTFGVQFKKPGMRDLFLYYRTLRSCVVIKIKSKRLNFSHLLHCLWSIADSNRLPQHCQCCALPDELMPRFAVAKVMPFSELANFCGKKMVFFLNYGLTMASVRRYIWRKQAILAAFCQTETIFLFDWGLVLENNSTFAKKLRRLCPRRS